MLLIEDGRLSKGTFEFCDGASANALTNTDYNLGKASVQGGKEERSSREQEGGCSNRLCGTRNSHGRNRVLINDTAGTARVLRATSFRRPQRRLQGRRGWRSDRRSTAGEVRCRQ